MALYRLVSRDDKTTPYLGGMSGIYSGRATYYMEV